MFNEPCSLKIMRTKATYLFTLLVLLAMLWPQAADAQRRRRNQNETEAPAAPAIDTSLFNALEFRNIGPYRGGRCVTVAGITSDPLTYYMGSTGGGVWKTQNAGQSWTNISDGYFNTGSVGAISVSQRDPNVVYVGMGEHPVRGVMTSSGDGVYRSTDAGQTWTHLGLEKTDHISEIVIHPDNPDVVFVAAQGNPYKPTEERGIYRSVDGGQNWEKILFVDDSTGVSDLAMDPSNPRILYSATWSHRRYPWTMQSGGPGSGLWKSTDGGDNWERLTEGLPELMGKTAITVSPANPQRLWANIEADKGGVYRSDNGGKKWTRTCGDRVTQARSWYYMEVFADPKDEETVYVLNAPVLKSVDGGKSFRPVPNPHSDQHDLWINPERPQVMALANDGGACITMDGGKSWSSQQNQPTAQFYRVTIDRRFPYHLYAGQQDNSTVAIPSRSMGAGIDWKDWYMVAGGESAFLAFDEEDPHYIYGGSYQGNLEVYDHETGLTKDVMAYPVAGLGSLPREMRYRFNWNAPLVMTQDDRSILYHGAQLVLKSEDGGMSWAEISPDLTRNDSSKQGPGGGPITNEGAGGENYNTLMYLTLSPHDQDVIWAGSDDGLVHMSPDGGYTWREVTPEGAPEGIINSIEVSPHDPATVYITLTTYKFGDFTPRAYRTRDNGATWEMITGGFADEAFPRVILEDRERAGLLYAGTETGLYISTDAGDHWHPFQLNLPVCPILDLGLRDNDLIVATSGRAFWILDDLGALQQGLPNMSEGTPMLFSPKPTVRLMAGGRGGENTGQNPPRGMIIDYFLPDSLPDSVAISLEILGENGEVIRNYSSEKDSGFRGFPGGPSPDPTLEKAQGVNRFVWDFNRESLPAVPGVMVLGDYSGAMVAPGKYTLKLTIEDQSVETEAEIIPDPRLDAGPDEYAAQQAILLSITDMVTDIHESVNRMRNAQKQVDQLVAQLKKQEGTEELVEQGEALSKAIQEWEENLIQPKTQTFQDVINFPNQLNAELLTLKGRVETHDPQPTAGAEQRLSDLQVEWERHLSGMRQLIGEELAAFNEAYREQELPIILMEEVDQH